MPHSRARRVLAKRERDQKHDIDTGGYLICDCSWVPEFSVMVLKVYRRPSKTIKGKFSTFASCERCGQTRRLNGQGWTVGSPPALALDERQMNMLVTAVESWKRTAALMPEFGGVGGCM